MEFALLSLQNLHSYALSFALGTVDPRGYSGRLIIQQDYHEWANLS
jgi:hypothetical protein